MDGTGAETVQFGAQERVENCLLRRSDHVARLWSSTAGDGASAAMCFIVSLPPGPFTLAMERATRSTNRSRSCDGLHAHSRRNIVDAHAACRARSIMCTRARIRTTAETGFAPIARAIEASRDTRAALPARSSGASAR